MMLLLFFAKVCAIVVPRENVRRGVEGFYCVAAVLCQLFVCFALFCFALFLLLFLLSQER